MIWFLCFVLPPGCRQRNPPLRMSALTEQPLALVDGRPISYVDYISKTPKKVTLSKNEKLEALDRLIEDELLLQQALAADYEHHPKVKKVMVGLLLREKVYNQVSNSDFSEELIREYREEHLHHCDNYPIPDLRRECEERRRALALRKVKVERLRDLHEEYVDDLSQTAELLLTSTLLPLVGNGSDVLKMKFSVSDAPLGEGIVASCNGVPIEISGFDSPYPVLLTEALWTLISEELVYQRAMEMGMLNYPKVVEVMVGTMLEQQVYNQVANKFSEQELETYYKENIEDFVIPEKVRFMHILVRVGEVRSSHQARLEATRIQRRLQPNQRVLFAETVAEHSEGHSGDIIVSPKGTPGIDKKVVKHAFVLNVGEVSQVFRSKQGYNVIYVVKRSKRQEPAHPTNNKAVIRELKNARRKALYEAYLATLRKRSTIQINKRRLAIIE
ncbi:MAG: hypothetical protein HN348_18510 [Proteobacteria bacterium]|nr:hypothetical protein [Pseudomonadota bacterium]